MNDRKAVPSPSHGAQLTLVAFLKAKPGQADELGQRLFALSEPARAEAGNIGYDLHRSNDDSDTWMIYENWATPADLDAHFAEPYMKEFASKVGEVLDNMDLRRYSMITRAVAPQT